MEVYSGGNEDTEAKVAAEAEQKRSLHRPVELQDEIECAATAGSPSSPSVEIVRPEAVGIPVDDGCNGKSMIDNLDL